MDSESEKTKALIIGDAENQPTPDTELLTGLSWNKKKLQTAYLISLGKYTFGDISIAVDVDRKTIQNWRKYKEFNEKVVEFIMNYGLSDKANRIQGQKKVLEKIENILLDKLDDPIDTSADNLKITPLLAKYFDGIKTISKEKGDFNIRPESKKKIDLSEYIKNIPEKDRQKLIDLFRQIALQAIDRKQLQPVKQEQVIDVKPENPDNLDNFSVEN